MIQSPVGTFNILDAVLNRGLRPVATYLFLNVRAAGLSVRFATVLSTITPLVQLWCFVTVLVVLGLNTSAASLLLSIVCQLPVWSTVPSVFLKLPLPRGGRIRRLTLSSLAVFLLGVMLRLGLATCWSPDLVPARRPLLHDFTVAISHRPDNHPLNYYYFPSSSDYNNWKQKEQAYGVSINPN